MPNENSQDGIGNIAVQGIKNSTINITQQLGKSIQYQELLNQLKTLNEFLSYIPKDKSEKRLEVSQQINALENFITHFKQDVLRLAETFNRLEVNTERLKYAKKLFDEGKFTESFTFLESKIGEITDEQNILLEQHNNYEKEVLPKLKHNSEEFLVLAISTMLNDKSTKVFEVASDYFERSIKSYQTKENTFIYAKFLEDYRQFPKSQQYYLQYLEKFANELLPDEKSDGLNNLAIVYDFQNDFENAIEIHKKALEIRKNLAETDSQKYLVDLSTTYNNLAVIYDNQHKFDDALEMFAKALKIRRDLSQQNKAYLHYLGTTLHNLAGVYSAKGNKRKALVLYIEALDIYYKLAKTVSSEYLYNYSGTLNNMALIFRDYENYPEALEAHLGALNIVKDFAEVNPETYLVEVAAMLNNVGGTYFFLQDFTNAENSFLESLNICRDLVVNDSKTHTPFLTSTLGNLAEFYYSCVSDKEKSVAYAVETIQLISPIVTQVPYTQKCLENALNVLKNWHYNDSEIGELIA